MSKPNPGIPFAFNYSTLLLLALALVIARCKKDDKEGNPPGDGKNRLTVQFSPASIPFNMVDSAVAFFTKENTTLPVKKLLEKKSDQLTVSLEELTAGNWSVRIYVYSRIANDNNSRRYDLDKTVTLDASAKSIEYTAPDGQLQGEWKTRVILAETDKSVVLTVALDPTDPYYDMQVKTTQWDNVYIDRTAVYNNTDGSQHNDGGSWECDEECFQNGQFHFDPNSFSAFSQRMANRTWVRTEIFSIFMNVTTGEEKIFYYTYTK
jgi:hypothetical protein